MPPPNATARFAVVSALSTAVRLIGKLNAVMFACLPQAEQHARGVGNQCGGGVCVDGHKLPAPSLFSAGRRLRDVRHPDVRQPARRRLRRGPPHSGYQASVEARLVVVAVNPRHGNCFVETPAEKLAVELCGGPGVRLPGIHPAWRTYRRRIPNSLNAPFRIRLGRRTHGAGPRAMPGKHTSESGGVAGDRRSRRGRALQLVSPARPGALGRLHTPTTRLRRGGLGQGRHVRGREGCGRP